MRLLKRNIVDVELRAAREQMVAADRERIAVAGDDPTLKSGFAALIPVALPGAS
jgi:hypothetical protein